MISTILVLISLGGSLMLVASSSVLLSIHGALLISLASSCQVLYRSSHCWMSANVMVTGFCSERLLSWYESLVCVILISKGSQVKHYRFEP